MTNAEATAETAAVAKQGAQGAPEDGGGPTQPARSQTAQHGASGREGVADSGMGQDESFTCGHAARRRPALSALWRAVRAIRPGPRATPPLSA